ncbi:glycoside hydrolase family 95 protein [Desarmillaria ectypa]|nr:glycoside hydrolase family 95 protein [Desarmillaria ectypa]
MIDFTGLYALCVSHFLMLFRRVFVPTVTLGVGVLSAPSGFPATGNGLWYTTTAGAWSKTWLPIGNGYLAAMVPGGTRMEVTQLNIESLWSGGPFADPTYNGGNKDPSQQASLANSMQQIRETIWTSSNGEIGNIDTLGVDAGAYGSYAGAGHLITTLNITDSGTTNYTRWLDLDQGVARTSWTQDGISYLRSSFCSHLSRTCTQHLTTTRKSTLPTLSYAFTASLESGLPQVNVSCLDGTDNALVVRGVVGEPGMAYEFIAWAETDTGATTCIPSGTNATLVVNGANEAWISWIGDTQFDQDAGNQANAFSFKGADPHKKLLPFFNKTSTVYADIWKEHLDDYTALMGSFTLDLGQTVDLENPTDVLRAAYQVGVGNTYLEWLAFNFGRYLLAGSARGLLPANLQGKWGDGLSNAWGADYHSNINIQMNYWVAEASGMDVTASLFDYFEKNWAPRGAITAQVLYNISRGWVTHNEMNIFGHTGMKAGSAQWADYPESNAWMMVHVWDHFDYTQDIAWWQAQGWPLIKGVAGFHLDKLIEDEHFKDGTLVVAPCNSPEQEPITLGCAHAQQLIWQLFNAVEKGYPFSGDNDPKFLAEVRDKRSRMDKGIKVGSWGQLQEWKVEKDSPTDTHRHLSHLIGLYPGYAIGAFNDSVTNVTAEQALAAAKVSLVARGSGTGPDADAGWEKAWRSACWSALKNGEQAWWELTYTIDRDFGPNLFSLYDPSSSNPIFQIDANLGFPGALLNMLIQSPDVASWNDTLIIKILPALPQAYAARGRVTGARVRAGLDVWFEWSDGLVGRVDVNMADVGTFSEGRKVRVEVGANGDVKGEFVLRNGGRVTLN